MCICDKQRYNFNRMYIYIYIYTPIKSESGGKECKL